MDDGSGEKMKSVPADGSTTYRVDRGICRTDWPLWLILAADVIFGLDALSKMPARVPVHWDLAGHPTGWGPAWMNALMMPAMAVAIYLLVVFLPLADPRRRNYVLFPSMLRVLRFCLPLMIVVIHVCVVLQTLHWGVTGAFGALVVRLVVPLLWIVLGNYLPQVRFNYFVGVRTPWTLDSESVWTATHRLAGPVFVICGLIGVLGAFLPPGPGLVVLIAATAGAVFVLVIYSWQLSRRISKGEN